jgi:hypothetical protein
MEGGSSVPIFKKYWEVIRRYSSEYLQTSPNIRLGVLGNLLKRSCLIPRYKKQYLIQAGVTIISWFICYYKADC